MWGQLFKGAVWFATVMGFGATVERWFGPGQEESGDSLGIMKYVRLVLIGGVIYMVFKLLGRKLPKL